MKNIVYKILPVGAKPLVAHSLLIHVRISFPLSIFRTNGQNLTKLYKCIYIDKICVNRILPVILHKFVTKLWPLIGNRILFLLNILRTNGWNFTKFCKCIYIYKIFVGIATFHICSFITELKPLIDVRILFLLLFLGFFAA